MNYVRILPKDKNGSPLQDFNLLSPAVACYTNENATASSVVSLNENTTALEVAAVGGPAALKWIAVNNANPSVVTAAGSANFDHIIPANTLRRFAVPIERFGNPGGSVAAVSQQYGLYQRVAVKSAGAASSILLAEF